MTSASTLVDRVKIIVTSSGTGAFALGPPVPAYRGRDALINGTTYSYAVEIGARFEAGTGVYLSGPGTLVRTPQISSNGGGLVSFPANIELCFVALAQDLAGVSPATLIETIVAEVLNGQRAWILPDETNGDEIPEPGSGLPYLSGGVFKIA